MTDMTPTDGRKVIDGQEYIGDGKGGWQPVDLVKPQHLLEDETVRKIIGHAIDLSAQVSRFKDHTFDDIGSFEALLAQEYDATIGGKKGNKGKGKKGKGKKGKGKKKKKRKPKK